MGSMPMLTQARISSVSSNWAPHDNIVGIVLKQMKSFLLTCVEVLLIFVIRSLDEMSSF